MYLGELAPKNLRGALGVVPQLFITIGILVAQLFGFRSLLATEEGGNRALALPSDPQSPSYFHHWKLSPADCPILSNEDCPWCQALSLAHHAHCRL